MNMRIARVPGRAAIVLLALGVATTIARATDLEIKPGDQVIRVQIADENQLEWLIERDLDIWSHGVGIGPVDVHVSTAELADIQEAGIEHEVLNHDLWSTWLNEQTNQMLRGGGDFDAYKNLADINAFVDSLVAARPDLCQVSVIGQSLEGRDIRALHITGAGAGPKPGVLYHGLQHAREWITGSVVLYIADHLVNNYDTDPCIQALVDRTDFYFVPVMNPDGYNYTWTNQRLWRKNRRPNGGGSFGVDLNRNWGHQWGYSSDGSSSNPSSETYRGTAPFSEPETQVMSNFILANPNIVAYMDYHSYGELIMWPWGYFCNSISEPDASLFDGLGADMHQLMFNVHGHAYTDGPICPTLYPANGCSVDWTYGAAGRTGMTIEVRDTGQFGFILPADQIIPTCEENLPGILYLSSYASSGVLVRPADALPAWFSPAQPQTLAVQIWSVNEEYAPGTAMMHYRFDADEPFDSAPLTHLGGHMFEAQIPARPCGDTIEFYFTAAGNGGFQAAWPNPCIDGITHVSVPYLEETQLLYDNFEQELGWITASENVTSGFWQRGVPVNDPNWSYDPPTDGDGSGQCWMTQNQLGNTDVDAGGGTNGTVTLISPFVDLSAPGTSIEYDYWLRLNNAVGNDALTVQIGDAFSPWTQIARHTSDANEWRHHVITAEDLAATGLSLHSAMRIRFIANDANPQSTVEAAVDGFQIRKTGCFGQSCALPGDVSGDSAIDGLDVAAFVAAFNAPPFYHACADLAAPAGTLDNADIAAFVDLLLAP